MMLTVDFETLKQYVENARRVFIIVQDNQDGSVKRVHVSKRALAESFRDAGRLPKGATYRIEWMGGAYALKDSDLLIL